ncbi:GA113 protein, partial [Geococcyx californianus]|nr:GA113 protein [Geococcyx californianus]
MDRQAAQDLFKAFLFKRNFKAFDLEKDLPSLLTHARSYGFFANPHSIHELVEWRRYGDELFSLVLDDNKPAKKISKLWKAVHNELLLVQAEKRAVEGIKAAHSRNQDYDSSVYPTAPNPPAFATVEIPPEPPPTDGQSPALSTPLPAPSPSASITASALTPSLQPLPPDPSNATEPVPGAESDPAEAMAARRRELWQALARDGMERGDSELLAAAQEAMAFPVVFTTNAQGGQNAQFAHLDWKLLSQLRATVGSFGVSSEPAKQMLDYLFNAHILLPADILAITKLIYTPSQRLLFEARWREEAARSANLPRPQGDPLTDLTVDELMGQGPYLRVEAQAALGPHKLREAMAVAKRAIDKVRTSGGTPLYMSIKQGRDESLSSFVDKVMDAISRAGIPDHMQDAILRQCILQNSNPTTRSLITSIPGDWTTQALLDKAATLPSGAQAFLVHALEKLGEGLKEQAVSTQTQVMAALAPLQAAATRPRLPQGGNRMRCYRCGQSGHIRRECSASGVWCNKCQSNTHTSNACRNKKQGNSRSSASSSRAGTQVAAANPCPASSQQQVAASDWIWQPQ